MKLSSATYLLALSVPLASAFPNPLRLILPSTYSQPTARRVSVGDAGHRFENVSRLQDNQVISCLGTLILNTDGCK